MITTRIWNNSTRLFLLSFLILFFELVCIRWLSSYVLYLGYFTNFILLGCLLGIGVGALLAYREIQLVKYLPILLFGFCSAILVVQPQVQPSFQNFIFFTSSITWLRIPAYVLLPLIFICVTAMFTLLSQELGRLLNQFAPLKAYSLNVLGSLGGILCFTLLGYLSLPSWTWFLLFGLMLLLFLPRDRSFGRNLIFLCGLMIVIYASDYAFANIWSPYYRINVIEARGEELQRLRYSEAQENADFYVLFANGVRHQDLTSTEDNLKFYTYPYTAFSQTPQYENALVVGAGGGNDVAFALSHGVDHVDAVEIDPRIAGLGSHYHPDRPYNDPRVTLHVNDARNFLEMSTTQYDLVVYALPDSLVLTANSSNIRLESYLFTLEAFQSVKEHLKPDGLFVLYNYYREEWLLKKITDMLRIVFGEPVYYYYDQEQDDPWAFTTIFAGPKASELINSRLAMVPASPNNLTPATDNWPFLYLKNPSLPRFYSIALLAILALSAILIRVVAPKNTINRYGMPFFFMGAAFTLLETKSIVNFFLLFGSTWLVNALVFFAILLVVLIANVIASRFKFSRVWILYGLLLIALVANYAIPLNAFLAENFLLRYGVIVLFLFSPIFFANLIYSSAFRDTQHANVAFGANLLGTMLGGATEYFSLYFGYSMLIAFAGLFYLLAFISFRRNQS